MHSDNPSPGAAPGLSTHETEPEPTIDFELLELQYGPGGDFLLDSDDHDALIAERQGPAPSSETVTDEPVAPTKPAARKAA